MKVASMIVGLAISVVVLLSELAPIERSFDLPVGRAGVAVNSTGGPRSEPGELLAVCLEADIVVPAFETNSPSMSPDQREALLDTLHRLLAASCVRAANGATCAVGDVAVDIVGHADDRWTARPGGNLALSQDRAHEVELVFAAYGIDVVSVVGVGATQAAMAPLPDTRSLSERRRDDRRVEVRFSCTS